MSYHQFRTTCSIIKKQQCNRYVSGVYAHTKRNSDLKKLWLTTSLLLLMCGTLSVAQGYDRSKYPYSRADFGCRSPLNKVVDVNTGAEILCKFADLDHRVPLKQAHTAKLSDEKIKQLAIDKNNVVWTRSDINRAKGPLSSAGFEKVLLDKGKLDGRRFNRHLRGTIATKQKYKIPLDAREKQFAYKLKGIPPTRRVVRRIPAKTFNEAIELVSKRYGAKVARKVAVRGGATFVPGPGWVVAGGLLSFDLGWYLFTGECDVCDATNYLMTLTQDKTETQNIPNTIPTITHEEEYRVLPTSFAEVQMELDHVRALVQADPWKLQSDTRAHIKYMELLEAELTKFKYS